MAIKNRFREPTTFLDTVDQRWEQLTADSQDVNDDVRLYKDIRQATGIILSDDSSEYGGKATRIIKDDLSNETKVHSFHIRFVDSSEDADDNPHRGKVDPLSAQDKQEFLSLRSILGTRAVREKGMLGGFFSSPAIGTVVKCELRGNIWWIVETLERKHESWDAFTNRQDGAKTTSPSSTYSDKGTSGSCAPGSSKHPGQTSGVTSSRGGVPKTIENPASNCEVPVEGRALLDMIAYNESRGKYNIRYGGDQSIEITDFSDHPRKAEKITRGYNTGRRSSAAGRYQFIEKTWDSIATQEGLTDFTPASQDKAAWALAKRDYKAKTGRDLMRDLKSGTPADLNKIGRSLSKTWTSLPGSTSGEELTSDSQFVEGYNNLLSNQQSADTCPDKSFS